MALMDLGQESNGKQAKSRLIADPKNPDKNFKYRHTTHDRQDSHWKLLLQGLEYDAILLICPSSVAGLETHTRFQIHRKVTYKLDGLRQRARFAKGPSV